MKRFCVLALSALLVVVPSSGQAQAINLGCAAPATLTRPFAFVSVNGQCTDLSAFITPATGGKGFDLLTRVTILGSTIDVRAFLNPDPSATFGITTLNATNAPMTYSFMFGTPIVPGLYTNAVSSGSVTTTALTGKTTVGNSNIFPAFISGFGSVGSAFTNLNVNLGTTSCVASGVADSQTCNQGTASNTFAPTFYDNLEALLTYTQDNLGSTVTFNGDVTLTAVTTPPPVTATPEPATLALFGTGLLAIGGWARRRRDMD